MEPDLDRTPNVPDRIREQNYDYEKLQRFNPLVSLLHSIRYKYLIELVQELSREFPEKELKVIDIGCAHAKTFGLLNDRFRINYLGVETNKEYAEESERRYGQLSNFRVINDSIENQIAQLKDVDLVLSLETFEHIPEHSVVRIVENIALAQPRAFMCSVPNEIGPVLLVKNIGSWLVGYTRHKEYSWKETLQAGIFNLDKVQTHGIGHKGFDWRWLAQTIRHNMRISRSRSSPFDWLPKTFSFSVVFVCLRKDVAP